jgi:hypothetical protein
LPRNEPKERFVIRITEEGMEIEVGKRRPVRFSACDALMLLDILSPLPLRIRS